MIMKNALIKLRENLSSLSSAEKTIAEYILANPDEISKLSIHELSKRSFSSASAVVRMCRSIGFDGYREFKSSLAVELAIEYQNSQQMLNTEIEKGDSLSDIITKITYKNSKSLEETVKLMDADTLQNCVDLLVCSKTVLLFGLGASLIAAKDAYLKFLRVSKPCIFNEDWHLQLLSARNSSTNDVAIICSYSGNTVEMIECAKALIENRTPIIAITRCMDSAITELADYRLCTTANESLLRSAAMSSRISQLNIIDILYTAYAYSNFDYCRKRLQKTHIIKPSTESIR